MLCHAARAGATGSVKWSSAAGLFISNAQNDFHAALAAFDARQAGVFGAIMAVDPFSRIAATVRSVSGARAWSR